MCSYKTDSTHTVCKKLSLRWFDLWSGQFTKDYNISINCTKNAAVSSKNKDWVAQSLYNVLKCHVYIYTYTDVSSVLDTTLCDKVCQ
jgi:hypothetical protein